ncbi:MAG: gliding motility-associated ABC transporter substrate-binding protein GldG [Flavobacteriaceae bacterium]|nr:gliding motility-associated ABC transporter substrate-binding protein GldG [Flavobacteriaceae bacterium]
MQVVKKPFFVLLLVVALMRLSKALFLQYDLTFDKRYSLSENTLSQLKTLEEPLRIDVFLEGDLPTPYLRFRTALDALLDQLQYHNDNFIIQYNDPFELGSSDTVVQEMQRYGMQPEIVFENKDGNRKESLIFPWLIVNYGERSERVPLVQKQLGDTENEKIIRSLQQLEYHILDGIYKVSLEEKKNLAVLTSHQTSENRKLADLLQNVKPYYNLAAFDLKNPEVTPQQSLENLNRFKLLLISNPREAFTQTEKYILDQYGLQGGKLLWMVNGMGIDRDSLFNTSGKTYGLPQELNLDDYFFHKGLRIQKTLIKDLYCAPMVLAKGSENNAQYVPYPWGYYPLSEPEYTLIGKDLGPVWGRFASPLDTLANSLTKTLLLKTSDFTKIPSVPTLIQLEDAAQKIKPSHFDEAAKALGYLVQGTQNSLFKNRIKPFTLKQPLETGSTEMVLFGDGNIAENQTEKGAPLALGYDKWTNNFYANRGLLLNTIHFLTDNKDRLALREKSWKVAVLDAQKMEENAAFWKGFLLVIPLLLSVFFGWGIHLTRSKQWSR